ncbi:MAG: aldo/keto reductase [Fimbriimonas sp.]
MIPTGRIPHLDRDIPRIVCGTDFLMGQAPDISFRSLDAFWEAGGRAFDSAHCYGANTNVFGAWTRLRGVEKEVIYFDKGCHPYGRPRVTREDMLNDIQANHRALGVEYTDLFVLHRDDENIPIGEIVDWLNEFKDQGLIGAFGGSNWNHPRIAAANEYAEKNGKQGLSVSSPNLCLAQLTKPLWDGCLTIGQPERDWYAETSFPLFAWSSTARGYFAFVEDQHVIASYHNDVSAVRRERAVELGKKYGVSATQIALAWVLNQPGNIFALCGLRNVANVKENAEAASLKLTPEETRWLEHGE